MHEGAEDKSEHITSSLFGTQTQTSITQLEGVVRRRTHRRRLQKQKLTRYNHYLNFYFYVTSEKDAGSRGVEREISKFLFLYPKFIPILHCSLIWPGQM